MGNAYLLVVFGILAAKGIGFYRDMVFAGTFGTSVMSDIYFQVFGLINLIFTGIGVALSTLVIKNINKAENAGREKAYAAGFIRKSALYLAIAAALTAILAPQIVKIILPEISGESFDLAVRFMYVMAPSIVFVVVAYIISGILQNEQVYFITAIMSMPFNAIIILSLFIPGVSVFTVGIVTTIGWFLHIAILLPSFYKKGYSLLRAGRGGASSRENHHEIFLIFISNMMFQLCFYTDRAFVSGSDGMVSTFNYASNLFITISSVFVVAMSTVVFPSISKNYEEGNIGYVNELLRYIISIMTAIFLPFILVAGLFGTDIIRLVYERGSFSAESTAAVASVFFIYTLGILGYVSQELFNKVLYLAGKYKYTVTGTVLVIAANILSNILVRQLAGDTPIGGTGLSAAELLTAAATSVLLLTYAVFVSFGIKRVVGPYWKKDLLCDILKIIASGCLAGAVYVVFNALAPGFTHGYITFIIPLGACAVTYLASLQVTGVLRRLLKRI